jgi:DNA-binding LacI/PurR family transcriptional regulator
MLIAVLEGEPIARRHVVLDTVLVVRGSTAEPAAAGRRIA